jgi:hypothetical protein
MEVATGWSEVTIGYWKLKENHQIAIYGELAVEEAMDLSEGRIRNERMNVIKS